MCNLERLSFNEEDIARTIAFHWDHFFKNRHPLRQDQKALISTTSKDSEHYGDFIESIIADFLHDPAVMQELCRFEFYRTELQPHTPSPYLSRRIALLTLKQHVL